MICSKFSIPIGSFLFSLHILFLPPDNYIITNVCRKSYTSVCTIRVNCLLLFSITPYKPSLTVLAGKYLKPVKDTAHSGKTLPLNTRLSPRFETYLSFLQTVRLPDFPSLSYKKCPLPHRSFGHFNFFHLYCLVQLRSDFLRLIPCFF